MNNTKHVRPLIIVFSNLGLGGIQRKIVDIVNALGKKRNAPPIVLLLRKGEPFSIASQITNTRITTLTYQKTDTKLPAFGFTFFTIYHILRLRPLVVLTFLSPFAIPVLLSKLLSFRVPFRVVVSQDHGTSTMVKTLRYPFLQTLGIRYLYPFADVIITQSFAAKMDLIQTYHLRGDLIRVIPNWTLFTKKKNAYRLWDMLFAGRFVEKKNVPMLLRVFSLVAKKRKRKVRMHLVGDGPEKETYKKYIQKHHLEDRISIHSPKYEMDAYYKTSKLFLFASSPYSEGFPMAILEAMACGSVVVTTDFGSAHEVIRSCVTGMVVRGEKDMAETVESLLRHPHQRAFLANNAYRYVNKYHNTSRIQEYLDCLFSV